MPARSILADDQLIVQYEPGSWRLLGPDGNPVFEARPRALYYQPLFGRWRDLPPGDRMSVDAVLDIHVRWQRGWVVGMMLGPNALWRPLVRWPDPHDSKQAEEASRALSQIIHRPLRMEDLDLDTPVTRVRLNRPVAAAGRPCGNRSLSSWPRQATGAKRRPPLRQTRPRRARPTRPDGDYPDVAGRRRSDHGSRPLTVHRLGRLWTYTCPCAGRWIVDHARQPPPAGAAAGQ